MKNVPLGIKYWKPAAEQGNVDTNAYLGDAYNPTFDNERVVSQGERDWSKSVHYYEMAVRLAEAFSRRGITSQYCIGKRVKLTEQRSTSLFQPRWDMTIR